MGVLKMVRCMKLVHFRQKGRNYTMRTDTLGLLFTA